MILRLAYVSTLLPEIADEGVSDIIAAANASNLQNNITGVIAIDAETRRVCQILEGEPAAIEKLFASICADKRHSGVSELDRSEVERRHFSDWGMVRRPMADMVMFAYSVLP